MQTRKQYEEAKLFEGLFSGLQRGFGLWSDSNGYDFKHSPPTIELYQQHLEGKISLGIVPITDEGFCKFATIDHDPHHKKPKGYKYPFDSLQNKINFLDLPVVVCKSKRGGAHIALFLDKPYEADKVRHILKKFAYTLFGTVNLEIFPKQIQLGYDDKGNRENGSFINLPYKGGNSRVMLNSEGKELNFEEGVKYATSRITTLEDLKPFKLLAKKNFEEGRNLKTWSAGNYLKKHYPDDYEDRVKAYNKLFNADDPDGVLSDRELESTILKSLRRKDYDQGLNEDAPKNKADPTAWRQGTKAKEIRETEYGDIAAVVEGLIFPGITFITGKSKIGKSYAALQLANAVETGGKFLDRQCVKGSVNHYSLEDGKRRNKARWKQMGINPTEAMYQFRDRKPKIPLLTDGLEEEIEDWIKNTPDAKLVIIDPYVKVKKTLGGYKLNAYENDNHNLQNLYTLANKYNIAIVFLHHTKKKSENDVFDEMNGSAGIQSNADSMIVLASERRIGKNIVLSCLPKDAEQQEFEIALNPKCIWEYVGKVGEAAKTELQKAILAAVKKLEPSTPDGAKAEDIKDEVRSKDESWSPNHVQVELTRLLNSNEVMRQKRGFYKSIPF